MVFKEYLHASIPLDGSGAVIVKCLSQVAKSSGVLQGCRSCGTAMMESEQEP